jgi:mannose-6-phosphate isomerase
MPAIRLIPRRIEKPWGRHILWPGFDDPEPEAPSIGEIAFDGGDDPELLIKYLFTSEKLSIQVHPDDAAAQASGYPRGKDEAWVVLAAEPDSTIGLGLTHSVSTDALCAAALDGSIETLLVWKPVRAGDVIYSPAGTIHAIGAGITLIEVQQNLDLTYRLYDYGRPRELHLDAGVAVSHPQPFVIANGAREEATGREILAEGGKFTLERWTWHGERTLRLPSGIKGWLIPVTGSGLINGEAWKAGECWLVEDSATLSSPAMDCLFAYSCAKAAPLFG